ncbi:MAG: hypothetical protein PHS46_07980 [Candidatus Omnitrophica bacterium]|nr:hypothetical protein [Candidatus Omnitrophota bacterium]
MILPGEERCKIRCSRCNRGIFKDEDYRQDYDMQLLFFIGPIAVSIRRKSENVCVLCQRKEKDDDTHAKV